MFTLRKKHNEINRIMNEWMFDNFYGCNIGYITVAFEVCGRNLYIYTNRPGILMGYHGRCVEELKNKLKSAGIRKNIRFIDLGDSRFIHEIRTKRKWL